jgi:hypothetical protein
VSGGGAGPRPEMDPDDLFDPAAKTQPAEGGRDEAGQTGDEAEPGDGSEEAASNDPGTNGA